MTPHIVSCLVHIGAEIKNHIDTLAADDGSRSYSEMRIIGP